MSNFKGTEGKWGISKCQLSGTINIDSGLIYIANIDTRTFCGQDLVDENEANALLISKAPEMLEMLENILHANNQGNLEHINFNEIEKLIKKVTEL